MIPDLNEDGLLPPGVHPASLMEIGERFGRKNAKRRMLYRGLGRAVQNLREAGVKRVYVDGEFRYRQGASRGCGRLLGR